MKSEGFFLLLSGGSGKKTVNMLTNFPVRQHLCSGVSPELLAVEIFLTLAIRSGQRERIAEQ